MNATSEFYKLAKFSYDHAGSSLVDIAKDSLEGRTQEFWDDVAVLVFFGAMAVIVIVFIVCNLIMEDAFRPAINHRRVLVPIDESICRNVSRELYCILDQQNARWFFDFDAYRNVDKRLHTVMCAACYDSVHPAIERRSVPKTSPFLVSKNAASGVNVPAAMIAKYISLHKRRILQDAAYLHEALY